MSQARERFRHVATTGLLLWIVASLASPATAVPEKIAVADTDRYHVRFDDGALTLNDSCPVRDLPLGTMKVPIFVNGRPVGFC